MDNNAHGDDQPSGKTAANISIANIAELLNDSCHDQILAVDTNLRIIAWNKACEEATGISKEDALRKPFKEVLPEFAAHAQVQQAFNEAFEGGKSFLDRQKSGAGDEYYECHFIPLRRESADQEVSGVLVSIHDITRSVRAEEHLQDLNVELDRRNKQLEQRTAELAHFNEMASEDIKSPLRRIYTSIETVITKDGKKLSDNSRSKLRRVQSGIQRIGLMADDMVRFSQITISGEPLSDVDLNIIHVQVIQSHQKAIQESGAVMEAGLLPVIVAHPDLMRYLWFYMIEMMLGAPEDRVAPHIVISYKPVHGRTIGYADAEDSADYHSILFRCTTREEVKAINGTGMSMVISHKIAAAHEGFIITSENVPGEMTICCYLKMLIVND